MNNNRDQSGQLQPNSLSSISETIGDSTTGTGMSSSATQAQNSAPSGVTVQRQMEQLGQLLTSILNSQNNSNNDSRQLPIQSPIINSVNDNRRTGSAPTITTSASASSQVPGDLNELPNMIMSTSGTNVESNTILEILKQQIGIWSLGRLQELLGLHTNQQNNTTAALTRASVGATTTTPSESQLKPPADLRTAARTVPTSNTSTTAIMSSEQSLQNRPDTRRVPCGARAKIPPDHNSETAYFIIPSNIRHGQELICSHLECRKGGVKFQYCAVCGVPVAKRFFRKRHEHDGIVPVGTTRTATENSYEPAVLNETYTSSVFPTQDNTHRGMTNNNVSASRTENWHRPVGSPAMTPVTPRAKVTILGHEGRKDDPRAGTRDKNTLHHPIPNQVTKKAPPKQAPRAVDRIGTTHGVADLSKSGLIERKRPFSYEADADKHHRHNQQEHRKSKKRRKKDNDEAEHRAVGKRKQPGEQQAETTALTLAGSAVSVEDPKNKDFPENIRFHHRGEHEALKKPESKTRLHGTSSRKETSDRRSRSSGNISSISDSNDCTNPLPDFDTVRQKEWAYLLNIRPQSNDDRDGVMTWLQRVVAVSEKTSRFARQQKPSQGIAENPGNTSSLSSDSTNELWGSTPTYTTDRSGSIEEDESYRSNVSTSSTELSSEDNIRKGDFTNEDVAVSKKLQTKSTTDPPSPLTNGQKKEKVAKPVGDERIKK